MGVVVMVGGVNFILYIPLLIMAFLELAPIGKEILDRNPNAMIISMLKGQIESGVRNKAQFIDLKADVEVYIGIYLIVVWFLGWSHFLSIIIYWQLIRIKYFINYNTQAAFRRLDIKITGITNSPSCPGLISRFYTTARGFISSMGSMEQAAGGAGAGAGGLLSRCDIF